MRTFSPKADDITRSWHVVDADGLVLGRLATEVASRLRGKHKPIFAPHIDTGDHVIVVNAAKVVLTVGQGREEVRLPPQRLPGRAHQAAATATCSSERPEEVVRRAVRGMLPRTRLGRQQLTSSRSTPAPSTPTRPSSPQPLDLPGARARS